MWVGEFKCAGLNLNTGSLEPPTNTTKARDSDERGEVSDYRERVEQKLASSVTPGGGRIGDWEGAWEVRAIAPIHP